MTEPTVCAETQVICPMEAKIDRLLSMQESVTGAFPKDGDGLADFTGHRHFHDASIAAARAQEDFWRGLRYDLTKRGIIWAVITLLGLASLGLAWKLGIFIQKISAVTGKLP